ncbi:MAG: TolC family protein [Planctomycetaceae bacterium]|nr:TolC family protein [Planctomycetaceae bacterium]
MTPADSTPVDESAEIADANAGSSTPMDPQDDQLSPGIDNNTGDVAVSLISRQKNYEADPGEALVTPGSSSPQDGLRFEIPRDLPGSDAAPLRVPPIDPTVPADQRRSIVESLFPDVAPVVDNVDPAAEDRLSLASLQQMALNNSPVIRQAAADVEKARGTAVQAGLYPNPIVGYEGDSIGTGKTAGYNGLFVTQEFVTADKLTLAQSAAAMEMRAAEAELRKARITLASNVRRAYFKLLVAQEQVRFNRAIAKLSEEVFRAQIDLVSGGEAAPYEPLQLRVFAVQARNGVVQAQNHLQASWRQLAATLGTPHLPRHTVAGSVEMSIPDLDYDQAAGILMVRHSDISAARSRIASASCNLRLQQVTPIPNITVYGTFQHDDTTPLSDFASNLQVSVPVPVFNKNQGNIATAHGQLVRANNDLSQTQNDLLSRLAEIHARRSSARVIVDSYRKDLLPDQVRVYRGVYERFRLDGGSIDFSQLVVAQQTLSQVVTSYLQALMEQWDATVDIAEIMQVDDMVTMDGLATMPRN